MNGCEGNTVFCSPYRPAQSRSTSTVKPKLEMGGDSVSDQSWSMLNWHWHIWFVNNGNDCCCGADSSHWMVLSATWWQKALGKNLSTPSSTRGCSQPA